MMTARKANQPQNTIQYQNNQNKNQGPNQRNKGYNKRGRGIRGRKNNYRDGRSSNNQFNNTANTGFPMAQRWNNQQYYNPYMQQQILYRTEMYIYSTYRNLIDINAKNSKVPQEINNNSQFFVIKSFSEEDVHKSIKYGVWSSSKNGNITLSNAFNMTKEKGGNVYLFFSCNGSGRYVGVAKMKTACDDSKTFDYWTQDGKWPGLFEVEWLFIKDVPFKEFKNIIITMKDGEVKPISNARDTQEIPYEQAKIMLEKIEKFQNSNTILEHFEFYDMRQANYEKNKQMQQNNNNQQYTQNTNNNTSGQSNK